MPPRNASGVGTRSCSLSPGFLTTLRAGCRQTRRPPAHRLPFAHLPARAVGLLVLPLLVIRAVSVWLGLFAAGRLRFLSRFRRALQIVLRWRALFGQAALPLFVLLLFLRQRLLTFFVPIVWCRQFELFSIHKSRFQSPPEKEQASGMRTLLRRERATLQATPMPRRVPLPSTERRR